MVDVLSVTGSVWQTLMRADPATRAVPRQDRQRRSRALSVRQWHPGRTRASIEEADRADIVILPELWLGPDEHVGGRYPA
jgi:hypothetical protein